MQIFMADLRQLFEHMTADEAGGTGYQN